jgi:hypothetical protein
MGHRWGRDTQQARRPSGKHVAGQTGPKEIQRSISHVMAKADPVDVSSMCWWADPDNSFVVILVVASNSARYSTAATNLTLIIQLNMHSFLRYVFKKTCIDVGHARASYSSHVLCSIMAL